MSRKIKHKSRFYVFKRNQEINTYDDNYGKEKFHIKFPVKFQFEQTCPQNIRQSNLSLKGSRTAVRNAGLQSGVAAEKQESLKEKSIYNIFYKSQLKKNNNNNNKKNKERNKKHFIRLNQHWNSKEEFHLNTSIFLLQGRLCLRRRYSKKFKIGASIRGRGLIEAHTGNRSLIIQTHFTGKTTIQFFEKEIHI